MSLSSKKLEKKKCSQRLNSIENNAAKRGNKTFVNYDKKTNSFINSKNFDILKFKKLPYFKRKKNYFNYNYKKLDDIPLSFDIVNNEKKKRLIKEINKSFNELKLQEKEIKKYQNLYGNIMEQNKTNQNILDLIINEEKETKKENGKVEDNEKIKESNKSRTENVENGIIITAFNSEKKKEEPISDIKESKIDLISNKNTTIKDFFLTKPILLSKPTDRELFSKTARGNIIKNNLLYPKNKERKKLMSNIGGKKQISQINFLKKELIFYDKAIEKDNHRLEKYKKKEKISKCIEAQNELNIQNKQLEDLYKLYNDYHKKIDEFSTVINFYKIKNDNYIALINDLKKKIEKNKFNGNWEEDISKMESDKKALEEHITLYKSENKKIKKENDEYKKKEQSLNEFIEKNLKILEERNKNNMEINNTHDLEQTLKKKLELKNNKIEKAQKYNSELNEYIKKSDSNKKNKLEEKNKYEKTEKEYISKIKKEINDINKEIQKCIYQNDVKENEMEMKINIQNNLLKEQENEIDKLNMEEEFINEKINQSNKELESLNKNIQEKNGKYKN